MMLSWPLSPDCSTNLSVNIASNRSRLMEIFRLVWLAVTRARRSATPCAMGEPDISESASSLAIPRPLPISAGRPRVSRSRFDIWALSEQIALQIHPQKLVDHGGG